MALSEDWTADRLSEGLSAAIIVAHPDDEIIWCGGLILKYPGWDWTILSLCRQRDPDRSKKFRSICDLLSIEGHICDVDDSNPPRPINPPRDIGWCIRSSLGLTQWDLCVTHGANGEYGHQRHREAHTEVLRLVGNGRLECEELWTFAYDCDLDSGHCLAIPDADVRVDLTDQQLAEKRRLVREIYGYGSDSFEVRACVSPEGFHRHLTGKRGARG